MSQMNEISDRATKALMAEFSEDDIHMVVIIEHHDKLELLTFGPPPSKISQTDENIKTLFMIQQTANEIWDNMGKRAKRKAARRWKALRHE